MRYLSKYGRLALNYADSPRVAYQFENHTLIVGDPTTGTGTGNSIDYSILQVLFPDGSNAEDKAGLNRLFWEAPVVTSASGLTAGKHYEVLKGRVVYNNVPYLPGSIFRYAGDTGDTVVFDTGTHVALVPAEALEWYDSTVRNHAAAEYFRYLHLEWGDEAYWDGQRAQAAQDFSSIR